MGNREREGESLAQARLESSKDFLTVQTLIGHLRKRDPKTVPTIELANVLGRPKRQVYGLVKLSRRWLSMTSGEFIANVRNVGYRITDQPRAALFESAKSGDRADGHLRQEGMTFRRVRLEELSSVEDVELFLVQQNRIVLGDARLELSSRIRPILERYAKNSALAAVASKDAKTPWELMGLGDPDEPEAN